MNIFAWLGLLLAGAAWILFGVMGVNLLSGYMDQRTCQTDCVQNLFFLSMAAGGAGLLLSGIAVLQKTGRVLGLLALIMSLGLGAVFVTLYVAGNFF